MEENLIELITVLAGRASHLSKMVSDLQLDYAQAIARNHVDNLVETIEEYLQWEKKFRIPKNATNLVCESTKVALVDGCPTFVFKLVPDGGGRARIREISLPITPRVFEAMKDFQANHIFFSNDEAFSVLVKNLQNHGLN
jgi:hypothetical protein